jgi:hypothetical protein
VDDFVLVVNASLYLQQEQESRSDFLADLLVGALQLEFFDVYLLSDGCVSVEVNYAFDFALDSLEDGFEGLVGVFGVELNFEEHAQRLHSVLVALVQGEEQFIDCVVDLILYLSLLCLADLQVLNGFFVFRFLFRLLLLLLLYCLLQINILLFLFLLGLLGVLLGLLLLFVLL